MSCCTNVVSESAFAPARPFHETVAVFVIAPADDGRMVTVMAADAAPLASEPMLHVTGPVPAQPVCETNVAPAVIALVIVTLLTVAAVWFVARIVYVTVSPRS